jgi:hypothetical protein
LALPVVPEDFDISVDAQVVFRDFAEDPPQVVTHDTFNQPSAAVAKLGVF